MSLSCMWDIIVACLSGLPFPGILALYIYCIIGISKRRVKYLSKKALWLNLILLTPPVGCLIYLLYRNRIRTE